MRILLVDDEEDIRSFMKSFVEDIFPDAQIDTAKNGLHGFEKTLVHQYQLIITDHNMPRKTGVDMVTSIRTQAELNKTTPIIVLSGFLDDQIRQFLKTRGISFADKPVNLEELQQEIETLCKDYLQA